MVTIEKIKDISQKNHKKIEHLHLQPLIITLSGSRRYDHHKIKTESYENNQK